MAFTVLRSGDERQVNTLTKDNQSHPTIARLNDGGWVVTWTGQDVSGNGIYVQRYNAAGEPQFTSGGVPADRLVNVQTNGDQIWSAVTGLSDGGWVVTWMDLGLNAPGEIHQQRYNAQGEVQAITSTVVNPGRPAEQSNNIEVAALPNGEWLVTWHGMDEPGSAGVYQQRFSASGQALIDASQQRVNPSPAGSQRYSDVATFADGSWIVTWVDGGPFDSSANIHMRRYGPGGVPLATEIVTDAPGMQTWPQVVTFPDGGWLVVWEGVDDTGASDIFLKRYDASGTPGETQVVNATTEGSQKDPHVAVHGDGSWVITWRSGNDVHQRRYVDGATSGPDMVVPAWLGSSMNTSPQVSTLPDGRWVVVWQTLDQDEVSGSGISQRIFTPTVVEAVTSATEYATGTTQNETLQVEQGGLSEGDVLDGGAGNDTLQMTSSGTIDLTLPTELLRFEALVGTNGNDRIVASASRLVQFDTIDRGAGNNDVLELFSGEEYDLQGITFTGIETIALTDYTNYVVLVDSVATALLIDGSASSEDTVWLTTNGESFTLDEKIQLFSQGVDVVRDASGQDTNTLPEIAGFNGDQTRALLGGRVRLDSGADAAVSDDLGRFRSLAVKITNRVAGEDRLDLIQENGVTIAGGQVFLNGTLIGTLAEDGAGQDGLLINFEADVTPATVTALVRALAYVNTASGSFVAKQRQIAVTLTDAGGAQSSFDVQVDIALPTGGAENRAPVIEDVPSDTQQVADTELLSPFANMIISDPDGDHLTVRVEFDKAKGVLIPQAGGTYNADTGIYTIEGTATYATRALNNLQFNPKDRNGPVGAGEETTFKVTVKDNPHLAEAEANVKVNAVIADRPPSQLILSNNKIDELIADGTPVGTLSAQDGNGQNITYSLVGAGDAPFEVVGTELRVKNGVALDYEQKQSYTFTIRASAGGLSNDRVVTISVNDVGVERTVGSNSNDVIKGGAGKDTLGGGLGDDKIFGGLGNDTLTGNGGKDIFVFSTKTNKKTNVDKINDFSAKDDSIWLDNAVFTKLGKGSEVKPGKLAKAMFWTGKAAHDSSDRIVYDKATGVLYYDADGTGRAAQVKIATLKKGLSLTEKDFFVI